MGSDWLVFQPWKLINNYIDDYALCPTVSMKRFYLFLIRNVFAKMQR